MIINGAADLEKLCNVIVEVMWTRLPYMINLSQIKTDLLLLYGIDATTSNILYALERLRMQGKVLLRVSEEDGRQMFYKLKV